MYLLPRTCAICLLLAGRYEGDDGGETTYAWTISEWPAIVNFSEELENPNEFFLCLDINPILYADLRLHEGGTSSCITPTHTGLKYIGFYFPCVGLVQRADRCNGCRVIGSSYYPVVAVGGVASPFSFSSSCFMMEKWKKKKRKPANPATPNFKEIFHSAMSFCRRQCRFNLVRCDVFKSVEAYVRKTGSCQGRAGREASPTTWDRCHGFIHNEQKILSLKWYQSVHIRFSGESPHAVFRAIMAYVLKGTIIVPHRTP